jgi:hypothetical protein
VMPTDAFISCRDANGCRDGVSGGGTAGRHFKNFFLFEIKNQFFFLMRKIMFEKGSLPSHPSHPSLLPFSHYSSLPSLTKKIIIIIIS